MQLLSLNMEGKAHTKRVLDLIKNQSPDVLCLQEVPEDFGQHLQALGYFTTFAPMTLRQYEGEVFSEGVLYASKESHSANVFYYNGSGASLQLLDSSNLHDTVARVAIVGKTDTATIATTHFTWAPRGDIADDHQRAHLATLLSFLSTLPPHILCGDFNLPRGYNPLYERLTEHYTDTIPDHYTSSLDRNLHRHGSDPDRHKLFDSFMVDYIFTQPPYRTADVSLQFEVSDHAAILGTITQNENPPKKV